MLTKKTGYSFIELSITLTIIALIVAGGIGFIGNKNDAERIKITNDNLNQIERAITDFININNYIPCPAPFNTLETSVNFGDSTASGVYNITAPCPSPYLYNPTATGNVIPNKCSNNLANNVGMVPGA